MPANPSMYVSGKGNLSIPPTGFVRIAPNFCLAIPRLTITAPTWTSGVTNVVDCSAALPASAKYAFVLITWELKSLNAAGSAIGSEIYMTSAATGTVYGDSGAVFILEQAATVAGTILMRNAQKYIAPVFGDRTIGVRLSFYDNLTLDSQPIRLLGYYD